MGAQPEGLRNRVFCSNCSKFEARRRGIVPLGWQELPDANGRPMALCPDCVRRALWMIEARLDVDPETGF